jgi:urea transport system substrate-binding protein
MEATYVGIRLWKLAVERAGTTDVDQVRNALPMVKLQGPMGIELGFDKNHFLARPVFIGALRPDGAYDVLWRSAGALPAEPFSRYHPDSLQQQDHVQRQLERCKTP